MCDLFGMSRNVEDRATRSLPIFSARYSQVNPHGWGIGWWKGNTAIVKRAAGRADLDSKFEEATEKARSNVIVAHVRFKTGGEPCVCNCHPFKHLYRNRDWLLIHNGWVNDVDNHPRADGETDSEQIFHQIMDKVAEYQESDVFKGQYAALKNGIKHILQTYGVDIRLNLIISDGQTLYAFHHYRYNDGSPKPIYMLRRTKEDGEAVVISTQRLSDENWEAIPEDRLVAINGGEILVISDRLIPRT